MEIKLSRTVPLAIAGLLIFVIINWMPLFTNELPDEAVSPAISKQEAEAASIEFIERNLNAAVAASFVMFQTEKNLGGYLQKEGLTNTYNNTYQERYPIDYYLVQADTKDNTTFLLRVHMRSGDVIGFERTHPAANQQPAQASDIADAYLTSLGYDITQFSRQTSRSDRMIYESSIHTVGEARLQIHLAVESSHIISFVPQFTVPETFMQWLNNQNKSSGWMSLASILFSLFVGIAGIIAAVRYREFISFKHGVWLAFIYLITASIHNFNLYPGLKSQLPGTPESGFAAMFTIAFSHLFTFFTAAAVYLALTSGDAMWRKMGFKLWTHWDDRMFGSRIIRAMGHGYMLCFMLLGLQSIMFLVAEQYFNVWSVNDALFSNYNLLLPMLFPLMAWAAAISEEAVYRLFGIALFKKVFRSTSVAVLATSMIWAIGHTSYPIYPAYTRFIEVTIIGLVFGFIMLRFGFLTAVYAHAAFDSILMAFSLIALGGAANGILGLVYIISPALAAVILSKLHHLYYQRRSLPRST